MPIPAPSPSAASGGPCDWDVDPEALGVCSDWATTPAATRDTALELASTFLWAATGRQYGVCPLTVRPQQDRFTGPEAYRAYPVWPGQEPIIAGPYLFGGRWFNRGCSACCNSGGCAIVLRGPVASVDEVLVDGVAVASSAYRVDISRGVYLLVRTDGQCWPTCQNFTAATTEEDTFAVTYGIGRPLPVALQVAAALLACEYVKALTGGPCKLPARMTRLTRQGVELEVDTPDAVEGKTGIREVDDVITALNPSRRASPPLLLSPDLPEACDRVTVWPGA